MSWLVSIIGKPKNVAEELDRHSETLAGQSKAEYDDAKPHLIALVKQNFAKEGTNYTGAVIKLTASGSGSANSATGEQLQRSCGVTIEPFWTKLV